MWANIDEWNQFHRFKKKKRREEKMEEKKFDSATAIFDALKKENVNPIRMYYGFIESIHTMISNYHTEINGAPAQDFFIQGLIAITGDPEAFEVALEYFMKTKY